MLPLLVGAQPATIQSSTPNTTASLLAKVEVAMLPGFSTTQEGFQAAIVTTPAEVGQWSVPMSWILPSWQGLIAIHTHVLPNGRVLTWQGHNDNVWGTQPGHPHRGSDAYLWDPKRWNNDYGLAGQFVLEAEGIIHYEESNAFCTGHSFLADGRLLVAGGHSHNVGQGTTLPYILGLPHVTTYSVATNDFAIPQNMGRNRWYPTSTTLSTGEVLITSGETEPDVINDLPPVFFPEVWSNGTIRQLTTANRFQQPLYPMMFATSGGNAFYAGPGKNPQFLKDIATTGRWESPSTLLTVERNFGSAVMYVPNKILLVGGEDNANILSSTQIIDISNGTPQFITGATMAYPRHHVNATLLPDGTVLVTGGGQVAGAHDPGQAVLPAEIWTPPGAPLPGGGIAPAGGAFRTVAAMAVPRQYHSTAVLLPDGRVLSAGGEEFIHENNFVAGVDNNPNAEMYSPGYLFRGVRPTISVAPSILQYAQQFTVRTSNVTAAPVTRATMIRLSSVTHSFNMNQRFNEVPITPIAGSPGGFTLTSPPSADVCPPGHYLLFLLTPDGVPSEAKIVQIRSAGCNSSTSLSISYPGSTCSVRGTVTATGTNTGTDFRWKINNLPAPEFNNLPTASVVLDRCNPSATYEVSVTALCSGAQITNMGSLWHSFTVNGCQCVLPQRPGR